MQIALPRTYTVSGTLAVPSGATAYLPPADTPLVAGQKLELMNVRYFCRSGSCTISLTDTSWQTGSLVLTTLASGLACATNPAVWTPSSPVFVYDGDAFAPLITAVSNADGLSCTFNFLMTDDRD